MPTAIAVIPVPSPILAAQVSPLAETTYVPAIRARSIDAVTRLTNKIMQSKGAVPAWKPEDRRHYMTALNEYSRRLQRISSARISGSREGLRTAAFRALTSFDARIVAAVRVAAWKNGFPISYAEVVARAERASFDKRCLEPVTARMSQRPSGKPRLVISPGYLRRGLNFILKDVLQVMGVHSPYEHAVSGLGAFAACSAIEAAMRAGYAHWLVLDIKNYFPSVKPSHLDWIPLARGHLKNGAFLSDDVPIFRHSSLTESITDDHINNAARQGLPLGSAASQQIASSLLGRLLQGLPGDLVRVTYVDDVALGARNPWDIVAAELTLSQRMAELPAGPLSLKFANRHNAARGVQFMQFKIRTDWERLGRTVVSPSRQAFRRLQKEVLRRHRDGANDDALFEYGMHWARSARWLNEHTDPQRKDLIEGLIIQSVLEVTDWT